MILGKSFFNGLENAKLYLGNVLVYTSSLYNAITTAYNTRALADSYTVESLPCVDTITDAFTSTPVAAMIPSGFKTSKFASILPNDGTGDFTVVRNSSKTRVNSNGLMETLPPNVIAPDYTDTGCPVLLIEPQSTNYFTHSNNFTDTDWESGGLTIVASSTQTSPDGTINASKFTQTSGTYSFIRQIVIKNCLSVFVKKIDANHFYLRADSSATGTAWLNYNFVTGAVNNAALKVQNYTNGWVRLYTTSADNLFNQFGIGQDEFVAGDVNKSCYVCFSQAEPTSVTSYIPTTTAIATRLADAITLDTNTVTGTITSITETIDGITQTPITTIPSTYTIPVGKINKIIIN